MNLNKEVAKVALTVLPLIFAISCTNSTTNESIEEPEAQEMASSPKEIEGSSFNTKVDIRELGSHEHAHEQDGGHSSDSEGVVKVTVETDNTSTINNTGVRTLNDITTTPPVTVTE